MDNCSENVECVEDSDVSRPSNIISSHVIYKLNVDEVENKKLEARICPQANRDAEK